MGEHPLYEYEVELIVNGAVADRLRGRFGFREIRLREEPFAERSGPGFSFWLEINGRRVFCKGANWVPPEQWPATVTEDQYRFYLDRALDAHFNMIRVWGGGIYERDLFYNLCDEAGILVWQDFMFASGGYPVDQLRVEIVAEATHQIQRLRRHPCLAVWCGCNEDVFSWALPQEKADGMADTAALSTTPADGAVNRYVADPEIYTMILRGLVNKLCPGVPYVESSPQSREDFGNLPESGNSHRSCWKYALFQTSRSGKPVSDDALASGRPFDLFASDHDPGRFREHFESACSFNSEFCIQGPPAVSTMRRFLTPRHQWPPDDVWTYHIRRGHARIPHHVQTMFIAQALFGPIRSLQEYVRFGQAAHAEMMRAEFENARLDWPDNGGTLAWMWNDCWPTANWSVLDYFRRPKPAFYAARRACAPLLPIIAERKGQVVFAFSNHRADSCEVKMAFGQEPLDGTRVWSDSACRTIAAGETARVHSIPRSRLQLDAGDYLFLDATVGEESLPRLTYFPELWRSIPWPVSRISIESVSQEMNGRQWITRLRVRTNAYARFCHLGAPETDGDIRIEDNFFDLCAGRTHTVRICSPRPVRGEEIVPGHWFTDWP